MESNDTFRKITYDDLKSIADATNEHVFTPSTYWELLNDHLQKALPGCDVRHVISEYTTKVFVARKQLKLLFQFDWQLVNPAELTGPLTDALRLNALVTAKHITDEFLKHETWTITPTNRTQ